MPQSQSNNDLEPSVSQSLPFAPGTANRDISGQPTSGSAIARTRNGAPLRIAHRRSPSELTPLIQERLAVQQLEMMQVQQQLLAQQQCVAAGMMPAPTMYAMPAQGVVGIPQMVPQMQYGYAAQPMMPPPNMAAAGHTRRRSSNNNNSHQRRHSLAVSEARQAAHVEQMRRDEVENFTATQQPHESPHGRTSSYSRGGGPTMVVQMEAQPNYRFPPSSPEHSNQRSSHNQNAGRRSTPSPVRGGDGQYQAQSGHYPSSQQGQMSQQFYAHSRQSSHSHRRSNSRSLHQTWRSVDDQHFPSGPSYAYGAIHGHNHRSRPSFGSVSSISVFTEGNQGTSSTRKPLFVPFLSPSSIPGLMQEGLLVAGTLRVNHKNRSDAYVSTDVLDAEIFICGSRDRNRAMEGDLVAVELLDVNDVWDSKREKEEKKRRRGQSDDQRLIETASGELRRKGSLRQRTTQKRNDDVEVEGQTLLLKEEERLSDEQRPLYAGHIVAILERPSGQLFSGTLGLLRPSSQATKERQQAERAEKGEPPILETRVERPKIVWFKPTDKCVPLMAIPTEQAPEDFVENHKVYADRIFVASIKRWPISSLHPFGSIVEELGNANAPKVEVLAILRDNNFDSHSFSTAALEEADEVANAMDAEANSDRRKRFEKAIAVVQESGICEQAITLTNEGDDTLILAIHTIDTTPFIRDGGALDRELRYKSAGVYMQQLTSSLIPNAASLKLGFRKEHNSPALTVSFTLRKYELVDTSLSLTSVNIVDTVPVSALGEEEDSADSFIDNNVDSVVEGLLHSEEFEGTSNELPPNWKSQLRRIALEFSKQRGGHLSLGGLLTTTVPVRPSVFAPRRGEWVFDEIKYKVNATVAQKLLSEYGGNSLLLQQSEPLLSRLESFAGLLHAANIQCDLSSSSSIAETVSKVPDADLRWALRVAISKFLAPAKYVVASKVDPMAIGHYWLGFPAYTHFTGPLRRYADHIVQRQVHQILARKKNTENQPSSEEDDERFSALASELSFRLQCAHNVQNQSIHLALSQRIAEAASTCGYILRSGVVIDVYESAFDVVIPSLSIEKRIHGDQLPLVKAEFDPRERRLELYWDPVIDVSTFNADSKDKSKPAYSIKEIAERTCKEPLEDLLALTETRKENNSYVQIVRPLQRIPVLVRADMGVRVLPSITISTIKPF